MFWKLPVFGKVSKIGIVPPRPLPGREGLAVALIVKNEARHIEEWARFHRRAGVRHFFVYDNGGTDGTLDILRAVLPEAALTVVPWAQVFSDARMGREIHNQVLAYAHAASNFGGAFHSNEIISPGRTLRTFSPSAPRCPGGLAGMNQISNGPPG